MIFSNATIITMDKDRRIILDGAIAIQNNKIIDIGKTAELVSKYPEKKKNKV